MHIALIISSLETGGAERVLSELANFWALRGDDISLITLCPPETPSLYPLDPQIHLIQLDQGTSGDVSILIRLKKIAQRILTLRKTLKAIKPNVIISFVDIMNVTTLFASRGLKIPIIVSERTHPAYHELPLFYKKLRKMSYFWADKVVCQTASAALYFSELPNRQKSVIPNPVKRAILQKKEVDIIKPVRQIVSIGRLCESKDFHTLIRAFSELISKNGGLKLTIYGEGPRRPALETLIQELNLTKHVFLPGTVKNVEAVLYESDLFVFPSRYEGFPNALCEAMAVGLPVIASTCSGTIDIIREGVDGRLFPIGDVDQLTALLKELVQDHAQRVKLSQGALAVSDRFSEASILEKWDAVLAEVVRYER